MSSPNRISAAQLRTVTSPANKQYKKVVWHNNLMLSVRSWLPLPEMFGLIQNTVTVVFDPEEQRYAPELLDFAIRAGVISYYAAVDLPETLEEQYELVYTTDLYETVCKHISQSQLAAIQDAVRHIVDAAVGYHNEG